jgi:amino acid transporter
MIMRKSEKKLHYKERIKLRIERERKEIYRVSSMIFFPVIMAIFTFIFMVIVGSILFKKNVPDYYLMFEFSLPILISSLSGFIQIRKRVTVDPPFRIYKGKTAIIIGWIWVVLCFLIVLASLGLYIYEHP